MDKVIVEKTTQYSDPYYQNYNKSDFVVSKIVQFLYVILTIIELLIGVRFILLLFGANRVGFVDFIYTWSQPLVAPFIGIFNRNPEINGMYFEWESLIAAVFYLLLFLALSTLINFFSRSNY